MSSNNISGLYHRTIIKYQKDKSLLIQLSNLYQQREYSTLIYTTSDASKCFNPFVIPSCFIYKS